MGSICLGVESVRGRSLVPSPPTRTTAFITWSSSWTKVSSWSSTAAASWWSWPGRSWSWRRRRRWSSSRRRRSVVVVTGAGTPASTCSRAMIVEAGGLGSDVLSGTNPTVISWRLANLRSAGLTVVTPPVSSSSPFLPVVVESTHERACTSPTLPASGVPVAHFWPFLYSGTSADGYFSVGVGQRQPGVPARRTCPGSRCSRPRSRSSARSEDAVAGRGQTRRGRWSARPASAGSMVPQMSKARPACHVVPTVGSTTGGRLVVVVLGERDRADARPGR